MMKSGKILFVAGCFLLSGFVANGQDAGQDVEQPKVSKLAYPSTEHYELGYVQPGKEKLCNRLLSDYEEFAPDRMDEYYKSDRFVQWTSGESAVGGIDLGRNEDMHWTYAPIFNDGIPFLFVRLDNFKFPFYSRNFVYGAGHSFVGFYLPFQGKRVGGVLAMDVKNGLRNYGAAKETNETYQMFMDAVNYYSSIRKREDEIEVFKTYLENQYAPDEAKKYLLEEKAKCRNCDFNSDGIISKRRSYLKIKNFFLSNEEVERLREEFEQNKQQYPNLGESSLLDEIVANTPKDIVPSDFHEINFVYFKGEFYIYIRKTRSYTVVVLHFPDAERYEEACYIGPKETIEINLAK
ncbi:MAG: hypothetical protein H6912_07770 [Kordiimonadaceae bacterium]|nr:hypothetical protein [Kordiimonadaceae bacterium]